LLEVKTEENEATVHSPEPQQLNLYTFTGEILAE
jgi:hypothetical protein